MKVTKLTVAAAALAAGTLLLTGCDPAATAGGSGTSDDGGLSCDSKGWGPLSGCGDGASGAGNESAASAGNESAAGAGNESAAGAGNESAAGAGSSVHEGDEPAGADTAPCKAEESGSDLDAREVSDTHEGSTWFVTDENGCVIGSSPEFEDKIRAWDQKIAEAAKDSATVHVTWIVVSIDVTGFRECVLNLREAPPNSGDHVSRRVTTVKDCEVQQVDAVYRPVDK